MGYKLFQNLIMVLSVYIVFMFAPLKIIAAELVDANSWIHFEGDFNLTENTMSIEGESGSVVFGRDHDMNETLVFDARFEFDDPENSWVAFKLRSESPGSHIWQNTDTYFVLIRNNSISAGKVSDEKPLEYLIEQKSLILSDSRYHKIEIGVVNQGGDSIPRLIFKVDDKTIIEYDDFNANNQLKFTNSMFSVNVFLGGKVEIETLPDDGKILGKKVSRDFSAKELKMIDSYSEKWSILQHIGVGPTQYYKTGFLRNENSILIDGPGSLVYKDMVDLNAVCFDLEMTEYEERSVGSSTILLYKSDRDSYFGKDSFGITFYSDGRIAPVVYMDDEEKRFPGVDSGLDLTQKRSIKIEWFEENDRIIIYIYIENTDTAYVYEIFDFSKAELDKGFIGILNNSLSTSCEISNIAYMGTTMSYKKSKSVLPVYLQDYIIEDGRSFLHWEYRADEPSYYKVMITDEDDKVVGEVFYPENTYEVPEQSVYDSLFIRALNIDGTASEKVMVDLRETSDKYFTEHMERIKIRADKIHGAEFYYSESKKTFYINGFNYIKLRFGDHSTFEPSTGLLEADYDPYSAESMFKLLKSLNFNTVRVFVSNGRTPGNPGTAGDYYSDSKISSGYMDNFADFLKRAQKYGIYVIVCFGENDIPHNRYFKKTVPYSNPQDFLFNKKFLDAKIEYIRIFLSHIRSVDPSLTKAILAVQEQNEFSFNPHLEPFSQTDGSYIFYANGSSYDMSDAKSRRELANDALGNYIESIKKVIKLIDPEILLTIGTSSLRLSGSSYAENTGIFPLRYNHIPLTGAEYLRTDIDFLDVHTYNYSDKDLTGKENIEYDLESVLLNTKEARELRKSKPVILGEYGSVIGIQDSFESAKLYIIEQRNAAAENGYKGLLHWTFDAFSQNELYSAMGDNGSFLVQLSILKPVEFYIDKKSGPYAGLYIYLIPGIALFFALIVILVLKNPRSREGLSAIVPLNDRNKEVLFVCNFFGEFELYYKGDLLTDKVFLSVKSKEMLIYMLNENREVSKDEIIEAIWGEKENSNPDNLFHVTLYKLRKSLKAFDPEPEYIICKNRLYSIAPDLFICIHDSFGRDIEKMLDKEELTKDDLAKIHMSIDYYKNKYLYSYDYVWADVKREYYHGIYEKALFKISVHYMSKEDHVHALKYVYAFVKNNPYHEEAHRMILDIHEKAGDKKAARDLYDSYTKLLFNDLGVMPSEKFIEYYKKLFI